MVGGGVLEIFASKQPVKASIREGADQLREVLGSGLTATADPMIYLGRLHASLGRELDLVEIMHGHCLSETLPQ